MTIMLCSQTVIFVLLLGFLGNWLEFLGVSIRNAGSVHVGCTLPADSGKCSFFYPSWYYNVKNRRCEYFIYGGCGGNANRFVSRDKCKRACQGDFRPEWCTLPADPGQCKDAFESYYYEVDAGRCLMLIYSGCGGNENRFHSREACRRTCKREVTRRSHARHQSTLEYTPHCASFLCMFRYYLPSKVLLLSRLYTYTSKGMLCLKNAHSQTRLGKAKLPLRDFTITLVPVNVKNSLLVVARYRMKITLKRLISARRSAKIRMDRLDSFRSFNVSLGPVKQKLQNTMQHEAVILMGLLSTWLELVGVGKTSDVLPAVCKVPKEPGKCSDFRIRYYYDLKSKKCDKFVYTGCKGNANNFRTLEQCKQICRLTADTTATTAPKKQVPAICRIPKDPGPCSENDLRFFYDIENQDCKTFLYGGCGGNANHFRSREECMQICEVRTDINAIDMNAITTTPAPTESPGSLFLFTRLSLEHLPNVCRVPKAHGPCSKIHLRFYYDLDIGKCKIYGGCGGSANHFHSMAQCKAICEKKRRLES
ncbi:hypothetical protein lerEdw1_004459 [Lerista edwardsae]|nr:hypothetical protein lerEdw1_004459 [Lerista edwardsae]